MHPRITLAILAAASLALINSPADARRASATPTKAPLVDVGAIPAYPTGEMPGRAASRARGHATKVIRTDATGSPVRKASPRPPLGEIGSGVVRSGKTGATARVSPRHAGKFQAYIDELEAHGAAVYYMGGIRPGRCSPASQHPCGKALDVCQDWRGHVSGARDCRLPRPAEMAAIAERHGLHEGAVWCGSPDYGHVQVDKTGTTCVARGTFGPSRRHVAAKKIKRHRIASRSGGQL